MAFCPTTEGAILSTTVTTCVAVAELPEASVTVQVTVVAPNGYGSGASFVAAFAAQLSAVVGAPKVTLEAAVVHEPASTLTVTSAGAVIVGLILSSTVTVAVAEFVLPAGSVTVSVTVLAPKLAHVKAVTSNA